MENDFELSKPKKVEDSLSPTNKDYNTRKAEIIADANIALARLTAITPKYRYDISNKAKSIFELIIITAAVFSFGGLVAFLRSDTVFNYFFNYIEKNPETFHILSYFIPFLFIGISVTLIYLFYRRKQHKQFLKQASILKDRIELLLRRLEEN